MPLHYMLLGKIMIHSLVVLLQEMAYIELLLGAVIILLEGREFFY